MRIMIQHRLTVFLSTCIHVGNCAEENKYVISINLVNILLFYYYYFLDNWHSLYKSYPKKDCYMSNSIIGFEELLAFLR